MHVLVVGAGMAGLHTAWALSAEGAQVTVVEQATGPLHGSSYGTGGYIGPAGLHSFVRPLAISDRAWMRFSATKATSPLRYSVSERTKWASFISEYLENSTKEKAGMLRRRLYDLAVLNFDIINTLIEKYSLEDFRSLGILHLFCDRTEFEKAKLSPAEFIAFDKLVEFYDGLRCKALEPALDETAKVLGGLHSPKDCTINAAYLGRQIASICQDNHVKFLYNTRVTGLLSENGRITGVRTGAEKIEGDAVVLASGVGAIDLLTSLRLSLRLPYAPISSAAVSAEIGDAPYRIKYSVIDESNGVTFTAMDERIRAAGSPVLGVLDEKDAETEYRRIYDCALKLFGHSAEWRHAKYWMGTVMAMPDALPLIGTVAERPGLYLNVAHGLHGVATSCACAGIIADIMQGRTPAIDISPYAAERFTK